MEEDYQEENLSYPVQQKQRYTVDSVEKAQLEPAQDFSQEQYVPPKVQDVFPEQQFQAQIQQQNSKAPEEEFNTEAAEQSGDSQEMKGQKKERKSSKEDIPEVSEVDREWIMKQAKMQRIGGTYNYFTAQIQKYQSHLASRTNVLVSIFTFLETNKITKAKTVILLKEYFEDYSEVCEDFHKKSYKYELPKREEQSNMVINTKLQLRQGMELLFALRKDVGNDHNRLFKLIKGTIQKKFDLAMEVYWGATGAAQQKVKNKEEKFRDKEQKVLKRIQRIGKVYEKGKYGEDLSEDVFVQMTKFVKEERELRALIFDWGREILSMRKSIMNADYALMTSFEETLGQFKNFNGSVFHLKKRKSNFEEQLKDQIVKKFKLEKMCTPIDTDYIRGILSFKKKQNYTLLQPSQYEQFLNEEYFGLIFGDCKQLLKGAIKKVFFLKSKEEELVRTVSDNLVLYNKKSLEVKKSLRAPNTKASFLGSGTVELKQKVKGIIFDSENKTSVSFSTNDRAEELVMSLDMQFGIKEVE